MLRRYDIRHRGARLRGAVLPNRRGSPQEVWLRGDEPYGDHGKGDFDVSGYEHVSTAASTAVEVQAELTQCRTLCDDRSAKKDAFDKEQEDVEAMRDQVDGLIRDIWDEVEFAFRREEPSSLRRKAREYGVYYVTRRDEEPEPEAP